MSLPKTYLFTPPADCPDPCGKAMITADFVRKLKLINPRITMWEQFPDGLYWPGKKMGGKFGIKTSLWIGEPGGDSVKIAAIPAGVIPEFTQLSKDGNIITKGWRAIFDGVITSGAATKLQI